MKKTKNHLFLSLFLLFLFSQITAQTSAIKLSGTISDGKEPLLGASVLEKGTTNGVITDIDGNYSLSVSSPKAVLLVSFVGYKAQEVVVGNRQTLNITLESDATLDEVVVVGYGTQRKAVVTGAIAKVKGSDLDNMPVPRIEQSLSGRTAGVFVSMGSGQPGEGATIRIRGTTSITKGSSDPLFVVDGVPVTGGIDYLNQGDVESIEVLKDAASAAIYGARAASGVIIVTTKQGKAGKVAVTYNMYMGQQAPARKLTLLNATQYATLMNEASVASKGEILFKNPAQFGVGTDWQDAVFNQAAPVQNHELGISVGTEKSKYYASLGYYNQTGIVASPQSAWERYTARINSTHKLNDYISIGTTLGYTKVSARGSSTNSEYGGVLSRAVNMDPITPLLETDPSVLGGNIFKNFAVVRNEDGIPYGISKYVGSEILNPAAAIAVSQGYSWADKIVTNAFVEVEPIKGLKFRSTYGADIAFWGANNFRPIYYLNAANRSDVTSYNRSQSRGLYWIWNNTLSYSKLIGQHNFSALVGQEANKNHGENVTGSVQNMPVSNIKDASLNFASVQADQNYGGFEYDGATLSYFGRINYDYAGKYLLTALLRQDGSPRFGTNNKFGTFPSVSMGWVLSEEEFIKNIRPINFLKIRASWGVNGNDKIGDFRYVSTVGGGRNYTFGTADQLYNGISPNAIANPDLRWERTTQTNLGFDAKLFKNVSLTLDVFQKITSGMLLDIRVPDWLGNNGPVGNVASLSNKGLELELGYDKKIGKVAVNLAGNVSFIRNEITDLGPEKKFIVGQTFSPQNLEITRTKVGESFGYFYGYQTQGIFQNQAEVNSYKSKDGAVIQPNAKPGDFRFADLDGNGIINADDRTKIGDPTPSLTYGFNLRAAYSDFDVLLFGQGVSGNQIFKATRRFDISTANMTADALGRWTGEGSSTTYPRLVMGDPNQNFSRSSDFYVEDGAFFRIKTLQIGYTLPNFITSKVGLTRLRVYVSGNNLKTFTKYTGFDPEIGGDSFGIDRGFYPQARSFMFGLSAGF
ncbi:MAG: TonB-dependent receptor [Saprospiraceae bacterium]|nr:TonB-dependent receptor [Saprospiraceae bacterium]